MRYTNSTTITVNKTEREILTRFEDMIDELNLSADEIEQVLFDISRGKTRCGEYDILINYEDD